MNASLLLVLMIVGFCLILPPLFRLMVKGKIYCLFIGDDGYVMGSLKKPKYNNEYIIDGEGAYDIIPDRVGLTTYPRGLPAFFQSIVPCLIYRRDEGVPLEIANPISKTVSAKEIMIGLEPHFLGALVQTSKEGATDTRLQKMLPWLMIGGVLICIVLIFVVLAKMGVLDQAARLAP